MAHKKRALISDGSSSGDSEDNDYEEQEINNEDGDAERELHEDPYQQRKRRRLNGRGKDDATYGIFGDDDDDERPYKRAGPKRKTKYVCRYMKAGF